MVGNLTVLTIKVDMDGNALDIDGDDVIDEHDEIQENETYYDGFDWATTKTPTGSGKDNDTRESEEVYV